MKNLLPVLFVCVFTNACSNPKPGEPSTLANEKLLSVNDVMVSAIAPATDVLWAAEDPRSDDDWKQLEDAAVVVMAAGSLIKRGGAASRDDEWAADPAWQVFVDQMIGAAADSRTAAKNRDLEALLNAGNVLYPPCEECHRQFHPGVRQSEQ